MKTYFSCNTIVTVRDTFFKKCVVNMPVRDIHDNVGFFVLNKDELYKILNEKQYDKSVFFKIIKLNPELLFFGRNKKRLIFFTDNYKYSVLKRNPLIKAGEQKELLNMKYNNGLVRCTRLNVYNNSQSGVYMNFNIINNKIVIFDEECFTDKRLCELYLNGELVRVDDDVYAPQINDVYAPQMNNNIQILARSGFEHCDGFEVKKNNELLKIKLSNDEFIECSPGLALLCVNAFKKAKDLKVNDKVIHSMIGTQNPKPISITSIEYIDTDNMCFNFIGVKGGEFMANGFTVRALN